MNRLTQRYSAPALEKGIAILQCLADCGAPLNLSEISKLLGKTPNELFRMLAVLERERLVCREADSGCYRLGLRLHALSESCAPHAAVIALAKTVMRDFVQATGQEIHLSVLEEGRLLVLCEEMGGGPVRISVPGGSYHDPCHTLSGRILLSHLAEPERARHLALAAEHFPGNSRKWATIPVDPDGQVHEEEGKVIAGFLDMAVWVSISGFGPAVLASTCPIILDEKSCKTLRRILRQAANTFAF